MKRFALLLLVVLLGQPVWGQPTQEEIQLTLEFSEFLSGERFGPSERQLVITELQQEYLKDPVSYSQSIRDCAEAYKAFLETQDPLQLGLMRQALLGEYYAHKMAGLQSAVVETILGKVQPLAWDGNRRMLLTTLDLDGVLEYLSFLQQAQGGATLGPQDREALKQQFVAGFSQLSDDEMGFVCSGQLVWQMVAANWQRANQEQQAVLSQQYSQPSPTGDSTSEAMSARDYQKLSRILMHSHAASMNMLESAGGSNRYWSVMEDPRYPRY